MYICKYSIIFIYVCTIDNEVMKMTADFISNKYSDYIN